MNERQPANMDDLMAKLVEEHTRYHIAAKKSVRSAETKEIRIRINQLLKLIKDEMTQDAKDGHKNSNNSPSLTSE